MPVTRRGNLYDNLDQTNTAGFLFRDDESSMDLNYAGIDAGEDNFPQLYAQKGNPNVVSSRANIYSNIAISTLFPTTSLCFFFVPSIHTVEFAKIF